MAPYNCDNDAEGNESRAWSFDENLDCWQPVFRKSSFSDINQMSLRTAKDTPSRAYAKEFRRYLRAEKRKLQNINCQQFRSQNSITQLISWIWYHRFNHVLDDWLCLALLGIIMAFLSVGVDKGITLCSNGKFTQLILWFYNIAETNEL